MCQYWDNLNLLSSILTILLTYPNSDTLLCYSVMNDSLLTVHAVLTMVEDWSHTSVSSNVHDQDQVNSLKHRDLVSQAI